MVTAAGSLTAGITAFFLNSETLISHGRDYLKTREYLLALKHPYPSRLDEKHIASWNVGALELATYQIRGYLGQLKSTSENWIKQCLISEEIFPDHHSSQFNDRVELPASSIDRQNLALLYRRIDVLELQTDPLLRTSDLFTRLLLRTSSALLHRYKQTEIDKLEKAELYLLRNAIYLRHGRPFSTAKLEKYANRKGWPSLATAYKPTLVTPIELCNALYLNELHATRELGALGRGILIRNQNPSAAMSFLKASLCSCLARPKVRVECREHSGGGDQDEFRDYVDLIFELKVADKNTVEWTFLDPRHVTSADLGEFRSNVDTFLSSALNVNAGIQSTLAARDLPFDAPQASDKGPFWGARISFTPATLNALLSNPMFLSGLSANMCGSVRDALESSGPSIPRMVKQAPILVGTQDNDLRVLEKPITFDDVRIKLTFDYIRMHHGEIVASIEFVPRMIVLHRTGIATLEGSYEALRPPTFSQRDAGQEDKPRLNSSMHYLVDKDGTIYSLMPDFYIGRHVIGLDKYAIGISNVGDEAASMTEEQSRADERLIRFLVRKYGNLLWLIGSSQAEGFRGTGLWDEKDINYREVQVDPGAEFMKQLRTRLSDLKLSPEP